MSNRLQFKEMDGLTFYKRKYKDDWVISGIDICDHLGYKNPYEQAYKIFKRYEENFSETSFLIPLLDYKNSTNYTPHRGGYKKDEKAKEIRCYNRPGLWFFTSKCHIPKANKLVEDLFKRFDELMKFLEERKNIEWKSIREAGKIERKMTTDRLKYLKEYSEDNGSKNSGIFYMQYTNMLQKAVSGLKHVPPNYRDTAPKEELKLISILESLMPVWIEQCIEAGMDYHEIYYKIKDEVYARIPLMKQITSASLTIS